MRPLAWSPRANRLEPPQGPLPEVAVAAPMKENSTGGSPPGHHRLDTHDAPGILRPCDISPAWHKDSAEGCQPSSRSSSSSRALPRLPICPRRGARGARPLRLRSGVVVPRLPRTRPWPYATRLRCSVPHWPRRRGSRALPRRSRPPSIRSLPSPPARPPGSPRRSFRIVSLPTLVGCSACSLAARSGTTRVSQTAKKARVSRRRDAAPDPDLVPCGSASQAAGLFALGSTLPLLVVAGVVASGFDAVESVAGRVPRLPAA